MVNFAHPDELRGLVGQEVAVSDWLAIEQARIDQFAAATGDRQWIHTDPERARRDSPYGGTIAHGFLSLALITDLLERSLSVGGVTMGVNYGLNRVRFPAPLPAGKRIRGRFRLDEFADIPGGCQLAWGVTVEVEGGDKPCCAAEWIVRLYAPPA
ncbi:MAG TPA: MaoC family dehydratase [Herpetosiphonaceae bacterium]|nr:MaoC family dehydratase [Herpetosiphonaceae bacterium]